MPSLPSVHSLRKRSGLFFRILYQRVWAEQTVDESAALAYHTLFSLLPVFVLVVLILSIFGEGGGIEAKARSFIYSQMRLDALTIKDQAGNDLNVPDLLNTQIEQARTVVRNPLTGLVGFAVLVYGASKIMLVIEKAFNRIYGSPSPRSWSRRIMLYWSVLTLGPLLGAASLVLTNTFYGHAQTYAVARPLLVPLTFLAGFFVTWLMMIVLYKIIPGTHVSWSAALMGGFISAVLWEIGKAGLGLYVRATVGGNNWYGALALVPLFMFWVYFMWSFTLLGLHVAYVYQFFGPLARQYAFRQTCSATVADLQWVLPLCVVVVRRFRCGQPTVTHEAAMELNLPTETTAELLSGLEKAHIVHRLEGRTGAYAMARPPEAVTALEAINAAKQLCALPVEPHVADAPPAMHTPALEELEARQHEWFTSHSLADLAASEEARAASAAPRPAGVPHG